ncbi:unnamed protein product [Protopolystoma xenopodis]|uniref:Uncharacterized protein n=1 Tax=Protopolystoma xenopodis TaxID=117903 RepID=A0A448WTA4_9PLAT|nr:unnamed protein product [Protopolystoma xenopodis]
MGPAVRKRTGYSIGTVHLREGVIRSSVSSGQKIQKICEKIGGLINSREEGVEPQNPEERPSRLIGQLGSVAMTATAGQILQSRDCETAFGGG